MVKRAFVLALLLTLWFGQAGFGEDQAATFQPKKEVFAVRHPKLHKMGRKFRRCCQVLLPVVQFVGGCAQIVTAVR